MKRIFVPVCIAQCLGILVFSIGFSFDNRILLASMSVLGVACLYIFKVKHRSLMLLCVAVTIAFCAYTSYRTKAFYEGAELFRGKDIKISGRVAEVKKETDEYYVITVLSRQLQSEDAVINKQRKVKITVKNGEKIPEYGDMISAEAFAQNLPKVMNIGDTDGTYSQMASGIFLTASADEQDIKYTSGGERIRGIRDVAYRVREDIKDTMDHFVLGPENTIARWMFLGDASGVDDVSYNSFRDAGVSHIAAVSGMHLSIVAAATMGMLGFLGIEKRKISFFIYLPVVWAFAMVANLTASVVRAAIMVTFFFLAKIVRRNSDSLNSLFLAIVIMLAVNPASFFDVGLRLSAVSTFGLIAFCGSFQSRLGFLPNWLRTTIAASISAQICALPLLVYYFSTISFVSVLANIAVCPAVPIFMILVIVLYAISFWDLAAKCIGLLITITVKYIRVAVLFISKIPYAKAVVGNPGVIVLIAYIMALISLFLFFREKRKAASVFLVSAFSIMIAFSTYTLLDKNISVTFINVGNGDCTYINCDGYDLLVDGGMYSKDILSYLNRQGVDEIYAAFVTHYNDDHTGGIQELAEKGYIKNLILPSRALNREAAIELSQAAKAGGATIMYAQNGTVFSFGDGRIKAFSNAQKTNDNDGTVYKFTYGENTVLLSGDIGGESEKKLVKAHNFNCDILKVPHHGSKYSSSDMFIRETSPEYAIVTVGENTYGHPDADVVKKYLKSGAHVFRSDMNGTIIFYMNHAGIVKTVIQKGA